MNHLGGDVPVALDQTAFGRPPTGPSKAWSFEKPDPELLLWDRVVNATIGAVERVVYNGWLKVPLVHVARRWAESGGGFSRIRPLWIPPEAEKGKSELLGATGVGW